MGTRCRIVVFSPSEQEAVSAASSAFDRIAELEQVLSDYRETSEIARLVRQPPGEWHPISADLAGVLRASWAVWETSEGAFDPAIGPLTRLWRETRRSGTAPDPSVLAEALAHSGLHRFEIDAHADRVRFSKSGLGLDFGGIGKGWAADEAMRILRSMGINAALIDFGGDVLVSEAPPVRSGWSVEVMDDSGRMVTVEITNRAVAASGDLEQFVEIDGVRYAHILSPQTGVGIPGPIAAAVIADQAWLADALASAACVLGPELVDRLRRAHPTVTIAVKRGRVAD